MAPLHAESMQGKKKNKHITEKGATKKTIGLLDVKS